MADDMVMQTWCYGSRKYDIPADRLLLTAAAHRWYANSPVCIATRLASYVATTPLPRGSGAFSAGPGETRPFRLSANLPGAGDAAIAQHSGKCISSKRLRRAAGSWLRPFLGFLGGGSILSHAYMNKPARRSGNDPLHVRAT